jgi:hypothetical protein
MVESEYIDKLDEERRQQTRDQVRLIVESFARDGIAVGFADDNGPLDDPADFEYLYREQVLLVRDEDLERARALLGDRSGVEQQAAGVTRLRIRDQADLHELLRECDAEFGPGVVTPEYALYVTPSTGSCCPASEPEVPATPTPYPPVTSGVTAGRGVVVSVVDVGWHPPAATDPVSPWLAGVTGDDEELDLKDIRAYGGHGTFVAGVLRCCAPKATVRVEGFLVHAGAAFEFDVVTQLVEGLAIRPDIISLSAGTRTRLNLPLLTFDVFHDQYLSKLKDTVLVAAAGNDATDSEFWPAAFEWAVGVGAVDSTGLRAEFSNFGPWVDVYGLGVGLVNAFARGTFYTKEPPLPLNQARHFEGLARWSGTSFATPLVSGKIAARMSATGQTARQAADDLLATAAGLTIPAGPP